MLSTKVPSEFKAEFLAPQSGHVSNFLGVNWHKTEPRNAGGFREDRHGMSIDFHAGPPAWTRLELAANNVHPADGGR